MNSSLPYDLIIGLDRSDRKADLHLIDVRNAKHWKEILDTSPENLFRWLEELRQQYPRSRVAICLEQPAGNLISFFETYEWITLYPINPSSLQKFRETFVTSRAKDDRKDAEYLAKLLHTHHVELTSWQPEDNQTRLLQQLVIHRRAVVDERTGLTNRLQALLKQYFPQALELCGDDLWRPLATNFLLKWPTLQLLKKAKPETIRKFFYLNGSRSQKLIEQRLERIEQAVALTDEPALMESYILRIQLICRELQMVGKTLGHFDRQIAEVFKAHPDREIFANLPGAGATLAPRLLASVGTQRQRFASAANLQRFSGVAPVTKQSGGKHFVHRRYLCRRFMRQSFHEFANQSILQSRWAAAYYQQQRIKGSPHQTAVRALAFKWQRIIWRCWQSKTIYKEETYQAALLKNNSPLTSRLNQITLGKSPIK